MNWVSHVLEKPFTGQGWRVLRDADLFNHTICMKLFFSRMDDYALRLSYHSNTERFCLLSFVRLGHHDEKTAWPQDGIRWLS